MALVAGLAPAARGQFPDEPPPAAPLKPMQFPPYRTANLPNGLRLVLVENHDLPIVSVTLALRAGARYDAPGDEGLADLTAELLTKGTVTRTADEISAAIEGVGGSLGAGAGDDFFTLSVTVLTDHLDLGFGLLSDVLLHPTFPAEEVELARKRVLSSLELAKSDPGALAARFLARALYGSHPYGRSETDASVAALTRGMLQQYAATLLKPANGLLVIAGDLTVDGAKRLVARYLGSWQGSAPAPPPAPAPPAPAPTHIILVNRPGSAQSNIVVGNLALGPVDPLYSPAIVANKILGGGADSRLFAILREQKGWTYDASSGLARKLDVGYFTAGTEVRTAVTDSALGELLHQLRRLRSEPVADSELVAAKGYLVGSFPLSIETPQQIASQVSSVKLLGLPDDYLRTYRERLTAVTTAAVTAAARRVIHPDSAIVVVVGDGAAIYDKLAAFAPVQAIDADGHPLDPADLAPKPAPVHFDATQLVSRRDSFAVSVQGDVLGFMTADFALSAASALYVEDVQIPAVSYTQRTVVRMDPATLATREVDQTGSAQGQALAIHLSYAGGRVRGRAQTPDAHAGTPTLTTVDTTLGAGAIDGNALQPLLAALPLAPGASWGIRTFEPAEHAEHTLAVKVTGTEHVTVPAGAFSAYRVTVNGGPQPFVYYVSQQAPRRLLKIEIVGQPLRFELVSPHPLAPSPR